MCRSLSGNILAMALPKSMITATFLFVFVLARIEFSACQLLKAKISCLDCNSHSDLSGNRVLVKCDKVKKLAMAITEEDGSFETKLPSQVDTSSCLAKLVGGPNQIYAFRNNMSSKTIKSEDLNTYTISNPLTFSTKSPKDKAIFGSSKTVDLPLPPEWGFAPTSYYIPFVPIIGIP